MVLFATTLFVLFKITAVIAFIGLPITLLFAKRGNYPFEIQLRLLAANAAIVSFLMLKGTNVMMSKNLDWSQYGSGNSPLLSYAEATLSILFVAQVAYFWKSGGWTFLRKYAATNPRRFPGSKDRKKNL